MSALLLLALSMLFLTLELLLLRRLLLASSGSIGCSPLALAKRFKISVSETTPESLPVIPDVGTAAAVAVLVVAVRIGPCAPDSPGVAGGDKERGGGAMTAGVEGPEEAGDGASTIHMRCERVATSLATVCASVEKGFTWKTGKGSLPSSTPRSPRMTEMK